MTEPLNYTTKAIADLEELANAYQRTGWSTAGLRFLVKELRLAEVFLLPDGGELMDRGKPRPEAPGAIFHPPYPVVALEYHTNGRTAYDPYYEASTCPKRIALAWEWDGKTPTDVRSQSSPPVGSGVVVASIAYYTAHARWVPILGAAMIPYDAPYAKGEMPHRTALMRTGRIAAAVARANALQVTHFMPLLSDAFGQLAADKGMDFAIDTVAADLMDEMNAYCDLCMALACTNVSTARHDQPEKLNRARAKRGELPLKDFHVLQIAGHDEGRGFADDGGDHGVRSHLRRGHIRRLGPERITWVNACMVRGSRPGFVAKQYAPRGVDIPQGA